MKPGLEVYIQDFLAWVRIERACSESTITTYRRYLMRFSQYAKIHSPRQINRKMVNDFFLHLETDGYNNRVKKTVPIGRKTKNYHKVALRMFLTYLKKKNITTFDPKQVELERVENMSPTTLSHAEKERLYEADFGGDAKNLRDKAVVLVLFETGMKVSELCALNGNSFRKSGPTSFSLACGVGVKRRTIALSEKAYTVLLQYCALRKHDETPLFLNNGKRLGGVNGARLTPRSIQRIVREYGIRSGIKVPLTPSVLRHSVANMLREEGVHPLDIQHTLGYERVVSMNAYIKQLEKSAQKKSV